MRALELGAGTALIQGGSPNAPDRIEPGTFGS
jgi:hypothetical protein